MWRGSAVAVITVSPFWKVSIRGGKRQTLPEWEGEYNGAALQESGIRHTECERYQYFWEDKGWTLQGPCTPTHPLTINGRGTLIVEFDGIASYLSIAEYFEHVGVKRLNGLVVPSEDLLLNGAQVQRVRHLLVVLTVPDGKKAKALVSTNQLCPHLELLNSIISRIRLKSMTFKAYIWHLT